MNFYNVGFYNMRGLFRIVSSFYGDGEENIFFFKWEDKDYEGNRESGGGGLLGSRGSEVRGIWGKFFYYKEKLSKSISESRNELRRVRCIV